jgi:hypothetical protein
MALIRSGAWLAVFAAATILASCKPRSEDAPAPPPAATAEPAPVIPVPPPAVSRAELLSAVASAASAFSAGQPAPENVQGLVGRRFSVRLPFGCLGPQEQALARYDYDAAKGSLKLVVEPQIWTGDQTIRALVASPQAEDIEGFWIARPWLLSDACPAMRPPVIPAPAAKADADGKAPAAANKAANATKTAKKPAAAAPHTSLALAPDDHTVGLVSVFEAGDSRLQRRSGRPYEVVRKAAAAPVGGFRLVLEGRIVEGPSGAVACRSDDPDRRPVCLVRVEFDRVAIEGAAGEMFGEWRS